jgi:integrase
MSTRSGSVTKHRGKWTARVTWTDEATGRRRERRVVADSKSDAIDKRNDFLRSLNRGVVVDRQATFAQFAEHYVQTYARPPQYRGGKQIAGMRSYRTVRGYVAFLVQRIGLRKKLYSFTFSDLRDLRNGLLETPTHRGAERSITNVNRLMSILRRIFALAKQEGRIEVNPFVLGEGMVTTSDENLRKVVLSREDEVKLLAACDASKFPRRAHLRPIIIAAVDTGCRRGELLKLQWRDVDLTKRSIRVRGTNTKTLQERTVPISERLAIEFATMQATQGPEEDALVFGVTSDIKKSFDSARRSAGITDLRFHDLRHTAATRLIQGGMPIVEVMRILGHTTMAMSYRYTNSDETTVRRAAEIFNGKRSPKAALVRLRRFIRRSAKAEQEPLPSDELTN